MLNIWKKTLAYFQENIPTDIYVTWFTRITYSEELNKEDGKITLVVPSLPHFEYMNERWKDEIQRVLNDIAGRPITLSFTVQQAEPDALSVPRPVSVPAVKEPVKQKTIDEIAFESGLHKGLTFDTFVIGNANRVAHSSAEIVCQNPGKQFNPFFIYGGVGLGKTHLMHSIGRRLIELNPKMKLVCINADMFIREVVSLSSTGFVSDEKRKKFDEKYRNLDALLLDDVQLLCKKGGTQSYLFGILEALLPANKQVIFTCDTYARQLSDFDDRIISRMASGLSVGIEPAEFELRAAIVKEKAKLQGVDLPEDVAYSIATRMNTNVRELEGALNTVLVTAKVYKEPITMDLAKKALRGITTTGPISIENIQKTTAEHFNIKIADMYSKSRKANIAKPRMIAMYLAKELTQKSLLEIGNTFGGRDHATVLHAVRKIGQERMADAELNHTLHLIEQSLKNWS